AASLVARAAGAASLPTRPPAPHARPSAPTRASAWIARLVARTPAWDQPAARGEPHMLGPVGRWTGGPVGLLVLQTRGAWLRVLLPDRPNGHDAWVKRARVRLVRTRWRVEIRLAARTLTLLRDGRPRRTFKAVVGAPGTPTPKGRFAIYETARQPDPHGFLGPFALHLTAHSDVLDDYGGGPGRVAIHGRSGSSLADPLGSARSHGCVRVDNVAVRILARTLTSGVPVSVSS
ncbi:L,D-transpeptidase, partial [Solirubrobacter ginsenosidimutans]